MVNIKIEKKGLWFLAGVMVLLIAVAYVMAYGSGDPNVHGHDAGEIDGGNSAYLQLHHDELSTRKCGDSLACDNSDYMGFEQFSLIGPWEIYDVEIKDQNWFRKDGGVACMRMIGDGIIIFDEYCTNSQSWEDVPVFSLSEIHDLLHELKGAQSLVIEFWTTDGTDDDAWDDQRDRAYISICYGN